MEQPTSRHISRRSPGHRATRVPTARTNSTVTRRCGRMPDVSFTALTPLAFLGRSAEVFPDKTAIVYGEHRSTYREFGAEATRLARALRACGVRPGDRVAYLCPNTPEMILANFGVPLAGAVLVPINTRLSPEEIRYILDHSGAKLLV